MPTTRSIVPRVAGEGGVGTDVKPWGKVRASSIIGDLAGSTGFPTKNRIINGAMAIDQRNAGAEVIPTSSSYTLDRFYYMVSVASKIKIQQVVDAPLGFVNSMKLTVAAQYSPAAGDFFILEQRIEGNNVADLSLGTAIASSITLSFWVKGSVAGTYSGVILNSDGSRDYAFTFPVTTSWTKQIITIPSCTDGTWLKNSGIGLTVRFSFGSGSTYLGTPGSWQAAALVGATGTTQFVNQAAGSTLNITGIQLEKGSVATEFEFRHIGTELALCQRYYQRITCSLLGYAALTTDILTTNTSWPPMRATPTFSRFSGPTSPHNLRSGYPYGSFVALSNKEGYFFIESAATGYVDCVDVVYETSGAEL